MSAATYGELLNLALIEAGRGAAELAATSSVERPDAMLSAYSDILRSIVEHTEFLYGSELNRMVTEWSSELHEQVATGLWINELRAMSAPGPRPDLGQSRRLGDASSGCAVVDRWWQAARYVRAGQDLLATHFGPLDRWRSPDAWVVDEPDAQRAALSQLAEIAGVVTPAGAAVLDRCGSGTTKNSGAVARAIAERHSAARMLSSALSEVGRQDSDGSLAIERLRTASAFDTESPDPVVRMQERLRSLRKQAFELESQETVGAQVTKDLATGLSGAHGHVSVILRACAAGEHQSPSSRDDLADRSLEASKAWAGIRTEWNVVDSPHRGQPGIAESAGSMLRDFAELTRDRHGWKRPVDIYRDERRRVEVQRRAEESLQFLGGVAASIEAIAVRQVQSEQLFGDAQQLPRNFVTSDLTAVRARLRGRGARIPREMSFQLIDQVEAASRLTREIAREVEEVSADRSIGRALPAPSRRRGAVVRHPTVHPVDSSRERERSLRR